MLSSNVIVVFSLVCYGLFVKTLYCKVLFLEWLIALVDLLLCSNIRKKRRLKR